ncbi:MAG: hypothetical protein KA354_20845 [Phycisphaerae bacterium]|nr:hypothetical protein [Phycisphaerae bacterium]
MKPATIVLSVIALAWFFSLAAAAEETADLRVTRVALFSSGVGYFECNTKVKDVANAELKFRTAQVNDILKSLVVQDFDGGSISTVGYASRDPVEKALKSFGVDITSKPTLAQLLDQLRGEPVVLAGPRNVTGVILGVEKRKIQVEKNVIEEDMLNLLTEAGLQQIQISGIERLKLSNEKIDAELRKALATLASSHDADKKGVVIHFDGQGERRVRASYLLEAPIWKTSYRLVLAPDKKPFIQGWATVENATEEDWKNVKLSLVSGRPISFTMDLYTPLYVPRPKEELELYASLRPPEFEAGKTLLGVAVADAAAALEATPPASAAPPALARAVVKEVRKGPAARPLARARGLAEGGQGMAGGMGGMGGAGFGGRPLGEGVEDLGEGVQSVASAQQAGELFEYVIATPVTIARQHSAMLPIINEEIGGEKLSIYNPGTHPKHPLNGLQIENTSKLNLMQGPITVFDESVYAGDAKLPDLKPGEKRLVAYALDLAAEVTVDQKPAPDELVSLRIAKGTLLHRHKYVDERMYTVKNKDVKKARSVLLEQPGTGDWKLVEPKEPFERTGNLWRFKVSVPAGKSVEQKVRLERVAEESMALTDSGLDQIDFFLRARVISPKVKEAMQKVVALRTALDTSTNELALREQDVNEAVQEQGRIRENVKVLEKSSDTYQKQIRKFDQLETRIEQLRETVTTLRGNTQKNREALEKFLLELDVE